MAPEQARGARDVDGRADLYALGAVGYFLVTGELPFKGTPAEVLLHQVGTKPVPPSRVAKGPCPPDLEDVILRCLEKRPEDRPQSAEALNGLLAAVKTPAPWTRERAERWWTEHLPPAAREAPPPVPPASPSADAATLTARPM
jgi:serine/threonine-protein kinase